MNATQAKVVTPVLRNMGFMTAHVAGAGGGVPDQVMYLSNEEINPDGKVFVSYRRLENVEDAKAHVHPHSHTVDQMYCWIGANDDFTGLTVELSLDGEVQTVHSPASVHIPAGVVHWHRYVRGSGHFMGILLTGGKPFNEVTRQG